MYHADYTRVTRKLRYSHKNSLSWYWACKYTRRALATQILKEKWKLMRNKQKGFSLIELLIVVAIILIIAAIAIPNLIRSRMAANEASSVAVLRTLNTSAVVYSTTYGGFSANLKNMGPRGTTCSSTTVPT